MRNRIVILTVVTAAVLCLSLALAQESRAAQFPEGWYPCSRCQNNADRDEAWAQNRIDEITDYDRRDLSGVWGHIGARDSMVPRPPFTEYGEELFEATRGEEFTSDGFPIYGNGGSEKDLGLLACDPLGWPRLYNQNRGFEFVMLPDRVLQFFEYQHTWRTIYTDGRELPEEEPPVGMNFNGWNVGHWEGDTFVVESAWFDDRSWILEVEVEDPRESGGGAPHTNNMRIVERWSRPTYGTLESQLTIYDPAVYTEPWVGQVFTTKLAPGAELWDQPCVPSEEDFFNENAYSAAGTSGSR